MTINDSCRTKYDFTLYVSDNSDLWMKDSVLTGCHFPGANAIKCSESSSVYWLISNYTAWAGCVSSSRCTLTMDNITFTDTDYAIYAEESTVNIYNTVTLNDMELFLRALS